MKDRIKYYMDYKSISAGELSSLLDVQRSNISHILNGRNKPGAAFIEKMLLSFPDLDARWLLTGEGNMVENGIENDTTSLFSEKTLDKQDELPLQKDRALIKSISEKEINKTIDKVVVLYSDGTFSDFNRK